YQHYHYIAKQNCRDINKLSDQQRRIHHLCAHRSSPRKAVRSSTKWMGQKRAHVTFARLAMSRSASLFSYFTTLDDVRVYRGVCYSEAGLIQTPECQTPMLSATFD